jgi:hypothetical protein
LPSVQPIDGPVPLPRKRPKTFTMAQASIPLPRPRPDVAGPAASDKPASPFDWLHNIFAHPGGNTDTAPADSGGDENPGRANLDH